MSAADGLYALIVALRTRLVADAGVSALVAGRVYTKAPQNVVFPWVHIGETQALRWEDGACIDGAEIFITLHVWARSHEADTEALRINAVIVGCLHGQNFPLVGHKLHTMLIESDRKLDDPDGVTKHGVISVHAYTTAI